MSNGMLRLVGVVIPVVALAFGSWALAQEPPKKAEAKPEVKKEEAKKEEIKKEEAKDILAMAKELKFTTFLELVKLADLEKDLQSPGAFTVFAPTDAAFKAWKDLDEMKKPENKAKLTDVLKNHIVKGKMLKADLEKAKEPLKAWFGDIKVAFKDGKLILDDKTAVTKADIAAKNGVLHEIDGVIIPEKVAEKKPEIKKEEPKKEEPKKEEPKKP
jgi:uncharacterized surface protein with fasciclin (FAS1) repeats